MSETSEHDEITHRLVMALDALPVPEEPTGFAAVARPSLARDTKMLLVVVALLLVLITTLTSPQFQRAATELKRYSEQLVSGPRWVGYYLDSAGLSASGRPTFQLMFASSDSPPRPATPVILGEDPDHGAWSPDRQRITVSKRDGQLYVGDRFGRLRPVADLGAGYVVLGSGWIGNDKASAIAVPRTGSAGAGNAAPILLRVTVDLKTGALERQTLDDLQGLPVLEISPDGRWLKLPSDPKTLSCYGFAAAIQDRVTGETVDVVDESGRPASHTPGFLSDGRIVVAQCDQVAHTLRLYVGAPGARPALIAVVPITIPFTGFVTSDESNDEILIASGPDAPQSAYVFDPTGRLLRRVPLPQLAAPGTRFYGSLSHDGKSLGFNIYERQGDVFPDSASRSRAGVVDLVTGQVTYLCDRGCFGLLLR
jgi:hypothetical protein